MKCPVCNTHMHTHCCPECGYDSSRDHALHPTFAPVGDSLPVSALRARRAPADALVCKQCGGTTFIIRVPDNTRRCSHCGWTPDPKPHLECTCGGRYFLVRSDNGALICPLCGQVIPPEQYLKRPGASATAAIPAAPDKSNVSRVQSPVQPPVLEPVRIPVPKKLTITAIACGVYHTVALYSDGQVRAVGSNSNGQCNVEHWTNITAIAAGANHTVGLKADGTVVTAGSTEHLLENVKYWKNIKAIAAGNDFTAGLKADGTLVHTPWLINLPSLKGPLKSISAVSSYIALVNSNGNASTSTPAFGKTLPLSSVVDAAVGQGHTVFLMKDRTCRFVGGKFHALHKVETWSHITAIAAGHNHTLGLRTDGTVCAAGENSRQQCCTESWRKIKAIAAGREHSVGLTEEGTLVSTGSNTWGQRNLHELIP